MSDLLQKKLPSIQENLINSLMALNDNGQLTYLIKELRERKISKAAEVFIIISLCIDCYPEIINHLKRQNLEQLFDACFLEANLQEIFDILERPVNNKVKDLLYAFIKQLADKYKLPHKKKPATQPQHLLDVFVQFVAGNYNPKSKTAPPRIVKYLLEDYVRFVTDTQKAVNKPVRGA